MDLVAFEALANAIRPCHQVIDVRGSREFEDPFSLRAENLAPTKDSLAQLI